MINMKTKPFLLSNLFLYELKSLLYNPSTYLFQLIFITGINVFIFLVSDFFNSDFASPRLLLIIFPWTCLLLVPALTMRIWGINVNNNEFELIRSFPVSDWHIIFSKFFSIFTILVLSFLLLFPFIITIYYLGDPDDGIIITTFFSCILVIFFYLSLSLFLSSLVSDPVGSFTISLLVSFFLVILGWNSFHKFLDNFFPIFVIEIFKVLSPITWTNFLITGRINFQSIYYFIVFPLLFILFSKFSLELKYYNSLKLIKKPLIYLSIIFLACIFLFIKIRSLNYSIDLTDNKIYSLSDKSEMILENTSKDLELNLFWSKSETSVPTEINSYGNYISNFLYQISEEYNFKLNLIDPIIDTDAELRAKISRIPKIPMTSGDYFYLGLNIIYKNRQFNIPYFDFNRRHYLEYDLIKAINSINNSKIMKVGILSPFIPTSSILKKIDGLSLFEELKKSYDLAAIPFFSKKLPDDIDLLLIIGTNILQKEMLYSIDQHLMSGKNLVILLDSFYRINPSNNQTQLSISEQINDISDLLQVYGVKINSDKVIGDINYSSPVIDKRQNQINYPFWMKIDKKGINKDHPINIGINNLLFVESGELITLNENHEKLVYTTNQSGIVDNNLFKNYNTDNLINEFKQDNLSRTLSVILYSPFQSAFNKEENKLKNHISSSQNNSNIILFSDTDWIFDPFSLQKQVIDGNLIIKPINDNLNLFLNAIDFLAGGTQLSDLRTKDSIDRSFTKIKQISKNVSQEIRNDEVNLITKINDLENKLKNYITNLKIQNISDIDEKTRKELEDIRTKLNEHNNSLRYIRNEIRSEIDQVEYYIKLINILTGPIILFFIFAVCKFNRKIKLI